MGAVLREFLHCLETVAGRDGSDSGDIGLGCVAGRIWAVPDMAAAADLSQGVFYNRYVGKEGDGYRN